MVERLVREGELLSSRTASSTARCGRRGPRYPDRTKIDIEHRDIHQRKDGRPARAYLNLPIAPPAIQNQPWNTAFTHSMFSTNNRFEGNRSPYLLTATDSRRSNARHCARNESLGDGICAKAHDEEALARLRIFTTKKNSSSPGIP